MDQVGDHDVVLTKKLEGDRNLDEKKGMLLVRLFR